MDNKSVLLFYYLLPCFSGVPAGVREDAPRRRSPSRHHETHHLHPVLDEGEAGAETLPQDAQLSDTYTGRDIISLVSVENHASTWTVFCKANLITATPYRFLEKSKSRYTFSYWLYFLSFLDEMEKILLLASNQNR